MARTLVRYHKPDSRFTDELRGGTWYANAGDSRSARYKDAGEAGVKIGGTIKTAVIYQPKKPYIIPTQVDTYFVPSDMQFIASLDGLLSRKQMADLINVIESGRDSIMGHLKSNYPRAYEIASKMSGSDKDDFWISTVLAENVISEELSRKKYDSLVWVSDNDIFEVFVVDRKVVTDKRTKNIKEWSEFNETDGNYDAYLNKSGEPFWGDIGAGVLPICTTTGRVLLGLRSDYVNEPGTWGGFGGKIDDREEAKNPVKAAEREFHEEAGNRQSVKMIPAYVFRSRGGGFRFHNFIGLVNREFEPIDNIEVEETRWFTLEEMLDLEPKHFGLQELLDNSYDIIKRYAR